MRINTAKNNVLRFKQTPVINKFERVTGTQNVSLAIEKHWKIRLKDENDVEKLNDHQFIIRQDELQRCIYSGIKSSEHGIICHTTIVVFFG